MEKKNIRISILLILVVTIVGGCAKYPLVDEAKKQYNELKDDPEIVAQAPNALKDAEEQLKIIRNLKRNGASRELINHHAYIAEKKLVIAREMALLNARQDELAEVEKEHQLVLAELQRAEALAALQEAEKAKKEAKQARQRSAMLAKQLSELEAEKTERGLVINLQNVLFDSGEATIKLGSADNIAKLSRFLLEYTDRTVLVEGFTDNTGSREANKRLSEQRAEAVRRALIATGVAPERIFTRGYGEDYAIADNSTAAGRLQNRRVEVVISDENGTITARRPLQ